MENYDTHYKMAVDHYNNFESNAEIENSFYGNEGEADNLFGIAIGKKARRKKAIKSTRATLDYNRQQAAQVLEQRAIDESLQPSTVALNNVIAQQPLVEQYVQNQGLIPQQNPAALALQATTAFQNQVYQKQVQGGIPDYEQAYYSTIDDNRAEWGDDEEEADEFFGSLITSVFKAGEALVGKINEKRVNTGKKPLFAGKNWRKLAEKINENKPIVMDALSTTEKAFLAVTAKELEAARLQEQKPLYAAKNAFMDDQTKQAIMQYLPYALVIAVIIFMVGKKS